MVDKISRYVHHGQSEKQEEYIASPNIRTLVAVPDAGGFMASVFLEQTTNFTRLVGSHDVRTLPHKPNGEPGDQTVALRTILQTLGEGIDIFTISDLISETNVSWPNAHQARIVNQAMNNLAHVADRQFFTRSMKNGENEYQFLGGIMLIGLQYPGLGRREERMLENSTGKYEKYLGLCGVNELTQIERPPVGPMYPPDNQKRGLKTMSQEIMALPDGQRIDVPKMVDVLDEDSYTRARYTRVANMMRVLELTGSVKAVGIGSDTYIRVNPESENTSISQETRPTWTLDPEETPIIQVEELGMTILAKSRVLRGRGMQVWLSQKELELLTYLASSKNEVKRHDEILQALELKASSAASLVKKLRNKVAQAGFPKSVIETANKEGYRLTTTPDLYAGNGKFIEL